MIEKLMFRGLCIVAWLILLAFDAALAALGVVEWKEARDISNLAVRNAWR